MLNPAATIGDNGVNMTTIHKVISQLQEKNHSALVQPPLGEQNYEGKYSQIQHNLLPQSTTQIQGARHPSQLNQI